MLTTILNLPQASTAAGSVDALFDFIFWISVIGFVAVMVALAYFMVKYRARYHSEDKVPQLEGHTPSEVGVSLILLVIVMIIFAWGWKGYKEIVTIPRDALEISVVGKQWLWDFEYKNGRKMTNEVVVPLGKPIKFVMTSSDVLHSFYVPNFRVKQDAVPNRYTYVSFTPTQVGEHHVFCAEYCGTAHSSMLATVKVVDENEYQRWQQVWEYDQKTGGEFSKKIASPEDNSMTPVQRGEKLYSSKACNTCHTTTGQKLVGPTFKGIYGKEEKMSDGTIVKIDENYLRESIVDPQAKIVEGFAPVMPTYKGTLSDREIGDIIEFIKSLEK